MAKSLVMSFLNAEGKKTSITINNVKEDVTDAEIKTAMETIIAKNIFAVKDAELKSVDSAHLTDKTSKSVQVK